MSLIFLHLQQLTKKKIVFHDIEEGDSEPQNTYFWNQELDF